MGQTEIILRKDILGLGDEGDIKKVSQGYARNYLLPFGFAVVKSQASLQKLEKEQEDINKRKTEKLDVSKELSGKIDNLVLNFEVNAGDNGKLFGSIGINDILNSIKEKGFEIEKNQISLAKAIKNIGDYDIDILFYGGIKNKIKVSVKDKEAENKIEQEKNAEVQDKNTETEKTNKIEEDSINTDENKNKDNES